MRLPFFSGALLLTLLTGCALTELSPQVTAAANPALIEGHLRFLADDALEGRDTGSRGHEIAALYIATQL